MRLPHLSLLRISELVKSYGSNLGPKAPIGVLPSSGRMTNVENWLPVVRLFARMILRMVTLLWQVDIQHGGLNATPSATSEQLVVGRDGRGGTSFFSIRSGGSGDLAECQPVTDSESAIMWSTEEFGPNRASPIVVQGYVYLLGSRGGKITIVDAATGALVEQARLPGAAEFWASPWANEGIVYCLDASGKTFAIKPGPTLDVVAVNDLNEDDQARFWSSPAISDGTIFIRSDKALYAISSASN